MGWEVNKLWKKEWPSYKGEIYRCWLDVRARDWEEFKHSWTNLKVEFFRKFAYTLGHVWQVVEIATLLWLPVWLFYKFTTGDYGKYPL